MAAPRIACHAGLRHDSGDPHSRQRRRAAPKNDAAQAEGAQCDEKLTSPSFIRWSIQEIRRIATRLARKHIQPELVIAWSLWRRAHQAQQNTLI
jgi:hypothetical protein